MGVGISSRLKARLTFRLFFFKIFSCAAFLFCDLVWLKTLHLYHKRSTKKNYLIFGVFFCEKLICEGTFFG